MKQKEEIESDESGKTLTRGYHSAFKGTIAAFLFLNVIQHGVILTECAIKTNKNSKIADVAWASYKRFERIRNETELCSIAPEICVDVLSSASNSTDIRKRRLLYLTSGAKEFWICDKNGKISFYNSEGKLKKSELAPEFPKQVLYMNSEGMIIL